MAGHDERALQWLLARVEDVERPSWYYRSLRGEKIERLLRRQVIAGLALSGRSEAAAALRSLADPPARSAQANAQAHPGIAAFAAESLALCERIQSRGPAAVLGRAVRGAR